MAPGQNPTTIDVNSFTSLRLSTLRDPMVWGGYYSQPELDSIIPGTLRKDTSDYIKTAYCKDTANWFHSVQYVPLYQDREVFVSRIHSMTDTVALLNPGKLMTLGTWKFVTDVNRGVHIYDDKNPTQPKEVAFLNVPGVLDIALKNNTLYANAYNALVAIDITDPTHASVQKFVPNAFPTVYSYGGPLMDSLGNVAVAWRADTLLTCGIYYAEDMVRTNTGIDIAVSGTATEVVPQSTAVLGTNASLSRFAISSDWLYAVDQTALRLFDIRSENAPRIGPVVQTDTWGLETIFRSGTGLFLGSMTGLLIYDHAAGGIPVKASDYAHITSCDPVVVQNGIAFVTLSATQTRCHNGSNELDVIDVSDLYNPKLLTKFPMQSPSGLAVKDSTLFVCEGEQGLAVLDIKKPAEPAIISRLTTISPEDVIADQGILTLLGPSGIWRYSYADRTDLTLLSFTPSTSSN